MHIINILYIGDTTEDRDSFMRNDNNYNNVNLEENENNKENEEQNSNNPNSKFASSKGNTARVIDVNEKAGCVSMHIPGSGVRPFNFNNLYDGLTTQKKVYENSANDSVIAALNGYNSCILCYGQTGKRRLAKMP